MSNLAEKSHWDHDCDDRTDVTATIVMLQPADLPMLSAQGKSFQARIHRDGAVIHETAEYAEFSAASNAADRWLAEHS